MAAAEADDDDDHDNTLLPCAEQRWLQWGRALERRLCTEKRAMCCQRGRDSWGVRGQLWSVQWWWRVVFSCSCCAVGAHRDWTVWPTVCVGQVYAFAGMYLCVCVVWTFLCVFTDVALECYAYICTCIGNVQLANMHTEFHPYKLYTFQVKYDEKIKAGERGQTEEQWCSMFVHTHTHTHTYAYKLYTFQIKYDKRSKLAKEGKLRQNDVLCLYIHTHIHIYICI